MVLQPVRRLDRLPHRVLLTRGETVNWIAFGFPEHRDLTGFPEAAERWQYTGSSPAKNSRVMALRAIADGCPLWVPTKHPDLPEWATDGTPPGFIEAEDEARRRMASEGKSARELAYEAEAELRLVDEKQRIFDAAKLKLKEAESIRLIIHVRVDESPYPYPSPNYVWDYGRPGWFQVKDVLALWPATPITRQENVKHRILQHLEQWMDLVIPQSKSQAFKECQTLEGFYPEAFKWAWIALPEERKRGRGKHGRRGGKPSE